MDSFSDLQDRLNELIKRHNLFGDEIRSLRAELERIKKSPSAAAKIKEQKPPVQKQESVRPEVVVQEESQKQESVGKAPKRTTWRDEAKSRDWEKFIGENLISRIGIIITVVGVGIGAKYTIENDLINPLTRIILGYVAGLILLALGIRLKAKYENYSAVLVSGAMAILYFITYVAYDFYNLMPQSLSFVLMTVFTVFTVVAAINYDKQVIAHIGLVGAYAVPFLLSDGSGRVEVLFSYMLIINVGVLILAFQKYWRLLNYAAFSLTWLIFLSWFMLDYSSDKHIMLAFIFLTSFFVIFYLTFLAYKLLRHEKFDIGGIYMLLANAFVFYGIAYQIIKRDLEGEAYLGLFTLVNAIVHFVVSVVIYSRKLADRNIFYMVSGLVLVFVTIAIPIQLDGNWVTLIWVGEAALLFWIGRTRNMPIYEKVAYVMMALSMISIIHDWSVVYDHYTIHKPEAWVTPFFNVHLLSSLLFVAAFGFINYLNEQKKYKPAFVAGEFMDNMVQFMMPTFLLVGLYFAFEREIYNYWSQLFEKSYLEVPMDGGTYTSSEYNYSLLNFRIIWIINYSLLFVALWAVVNRYWIGRKWPSAVNLFAGSVALLSYLTAGLMAASELRSDYTNEYFAQFYPPNDFMLHIRYVMYVAFAFMLWATSLLVIKDFPRAKVRKTFFVALHTSVLWTLAAELIHWLQLADKDNSYKLALSILFGSYALFLIVLGLWKRQRYLRVSAIALFAVTLIKLFFYDLSHLSTISLTIVFVSLGVLLLIISFLYNKYKDILLEQTDTVNHES